MLVSLSASEFPVYIVTDRFGDLLDLDKRAATLLNISPRRIFPSNLLHFFTDGRLQLAEDLRTVASIDFPTREVILRPKERAPRRVVVSVCLIADGVQWTLHDLGPLKPGNTAGRRRRACAGTRDAETRYA